MLLIDCQLASVSINITVNGKIFMIRKLYIFLNKTYFLVVSLCFLFKEKKNKVCDSKSQGNLPVLMTVFASLTGNL